MFIGYAILFIGTVRAHFSKEIFTSVSLQNAFNAKAGNGCSFIFNCN